MSKRDNPPVTFLASFPAIKSAIIVGQDGMQVKLEIPESEMPKAVQLLAMRDKVLRVTVEIVSNGKQSVTGDFSMKDTQS